MSAKRKRFKVTRNGKTLTVYPYGRLRWRFGWRETETSPWRYLTRGTQDEARQAAWDRLGEIDSGGLVWSALDGVTRRFLEDVHRLATPEDFDAVKSFLASRRKSSEVVASVERFMEFKIAEAGHESRHLSNVRRDLEAMAKAFAGRSVVDISDGDLREWWAARVAGLADKTRNEVRGNLTAFWNWAVVDGIHPATVTPAKKLPRVKDVARSRDILILTPAGFLALAATVEEEWRPWIVLGAFCGLRPEEVVPSTSSKMKTRRDKRGLRREEINWRFRTIRLPREVSKVRRTRNIPLSDAALEWLAWAGVEEGQTGPVCLRNPTDEEETGRLGKEVFGGAWPQDVLRHTYASIRLAEIHSFARVAKEMGTSERMLQQDYHNPRAEEEAREWLAIRPSDIRFGPISSGLDTNSENLPLVVGL